MDSSALIPPLAGSFFGVISAFALNYLYQFYRDAKDKIYYINMIKAEIVKCIDALNPNKGFLLPIDRWTSAVNSGALRRFKVNEVDKLSGAYYEIQGYNYEAKRTRDLGEVYRQSPASSGSRGFNLKNWQDSSQNLELTGNKLTNHLQKLLSEEWLNPATMAKHRWQFWKMR
jgi:hypothetical protein